MKLFSDYFHQQYEEALNRLENGDQFLDLRDDKPNVGFSHLSQGSQNENKNNNEFLAQTETKNVHHNVPDFGNSHQKHQFADQIKDITTTQEFNENHHLDGQPVQLHQQHLQQHQPLQELHQQNH